MSPFPRRMVSAQGPRLRGTTPAFRAHIPPHEQPGHPVGKGFPWRPESPRDGRSHVPGREPFPGHGTGAACYDARPGGTPATGRRWPPGTGGAMLYRSLDRIAAEADVLAAPDLPASRGLSRRERLERWAELLGREPGRRLRALHGIEYGSS